MATGEDGLSSQDTVDPDYQHSSATSNNPDINLTLEQEDAKEQAVHKIQKVIRQQFALEFRIKEKEIDLIDQKIHQARMMLDRLRACILASQYGSVTSKRGITRSATPSFPSILNLKRKIQQSSLMMKTKTKPKSTDLNDNFPRSIKERSLIPKPSTLNSESAALIRHTSQSNSLIRNLHKPVTDIKPYVNKCVNINSTKQDQIVVVDQETNKPGRTTFVPMILPSVKPNDLNAQQGGAVKPELPEFTSKLNHNGASRFYVKKRIIVGNTSKYIPLEEREGLDRSTHKWMVYVRGPPEDTHIEKYIQKVWFFLHPSYRPNDLVEVSQPPFRLTRRGWGEFPIRVQLHFVDSRNKRVDIIHPIKLDQTYTGLQTLGSETTVDLELDKDTVELTSLPREENITEPLPQKVVINSKYVCVGSSLNQAAVNHSIPNNSLNHILKRKLDDITYSSCNDTKKVKTETRTSTVCSSAISTPLSSLPGSRCGSPETVGTKSCTLPADMQNILNKAIPNFLLINPNKKVSIEPYAAISCQEFFSWNLGKRRACEWSRALALKRFVQSKYVCNITTKEVMRWCRFYGYTPTDIPTAAEPTSLCRYCGNENKHLKDCQTFNTSDITLSCAHKIIEELRRQNTNFPPAPNMDIDSDSEVDVVGNFHTPAKATKINSKPIITLPLTEDLQWVREKASEIGVSFESVVWDQVCMPGTEKVLSSACESFLSELIRKSYSIVCEQTTPYGPKVILPVHIRQAIVRNSRFDFLTNSSLGVTTESVAKS